MSDENYKQQEKNCIMRLSRNEAVMILELREHQFGQFTIHKNMGEPTRIVIGGSKILDPNLASDNQDIQFINP